MYTYEGHMMHDAWYFVDDHTDIVHMFHLAEPLNGGPSFVGHAISRDLVNMGTPADGPASRPARFLGRPPSLHRKRHRARRPVLDGLLRHRPHRQHPRRAVPRPTRRNGRLRRPHDLDQAARKPSDRGRLSPLRADGHRSAQDEPLARPLPVRQLRGCLPASLRPQGRRPTGERGTVALACSTDMRNWEVLPPLEHDRISDEMEVPQLYIIGDRWYLVFCTLGRFLTPEHAERFR